MENEDFISAKLPLKITKKRKWFLASCPILDVHSQGETEKKAHKYLEEALTLFFISCFERDALDSVLKDCGFKAVTPTTSQKKSGLVSKKYFDGIISFDK